LGQTVASASGSYRWPVGLRVMTDAQLDMTCINTIRTLSIGMRSFGASAPLKDLMKKFGFSPEHVVAAAQEQLKLTRR
jgi:transketolase